MIVRQGAAASVVALFLFCGAALGADAEAGKAKAPVCAACHGNDGNSTDPAVPSIAGQPAQAIAMQLYQFREGNRKDPQMSPMAKNLSNADMNNLADYFASLKAAPPKHQTAADSKTAGPELAKKFNCSQCHGPALLGQQHIPRLAGQQAQYLRVQLKGFKAGTRADMDGNMTAAAQALSDKDIEVLVDYLAGLGAQ
ncbi:MAG TPA: c-type cytochrome [Burkholderiales bacterium]|nr:c-type cytochrome [Burkholderiales bacterium]